MANTTFMGRVQNKFDTLAHWEATAAKALVLLSGEIAFVQVPASATAVDGDAARPQYLMKVGDGTTTFENLPWLSAKAADVYSWAKAATKPSYTANEIGGLAEYINGEIQDTDTQYQVVKNGNMGFKLQSKPKGGTTWTDVSTIALTAPVYTLATGTANGTVSFNGTNVPVKGLGSAAYTDSTAYDAAGAASTVKTQAANDATTKANKALEDAKRYTDNATAGLTGAMHYKGAVTAIPPTTGTYVAGDVVTMGSKEYVYDGTTWRELGDEGSHVLKTQRINGHALSGDVTLSASDVGAATAANITAEIQKLDVATIGGTGKYIQSVSETNGKIEAVAANMPTALKNPNTLTVGTKTYDGSAAVKVVANDLGLHKVATSGKVDDLGQTNYFIINCGSATTVI